MPKLIYGMLVLAAIALPMPVVATTMMSCNGKPPTPSVDITFGNGLEISNLKIISKSFEIQAGYKNELLNKSRKSSPYFAIQQLNSNKDHLRFNLLQKHRLIAKLHLRVSHKTENFVGTMILKGRTYWLSCGEIG